KSVTNDETVAGSTASLGSASTTWRSSTCTPGPERRVPKRCGAELLPGLVQAVASSIDPETSIWRRVRRTSRLLQPSRSQPGGSLACARARSGDETQRVIGCVLGVGELRSAAAAAELGALTLAVEGPHGLTADGAGGSTAGLAHPSGGERRKDDVLEHLATMAWTGERHGHS